MGYLIEMLVDLIATIWCADNELRGRSIFGKSKLERSLRRTWGWSLGITLALLGVAWLIWENS